ncbi:hypothetical protein KFV02_05805 [Desulfohalobiaceae bacterium Ax17]|jgi:hypothetical protein|uniref:hypothetical protein n=1 Tax=Desulfovulcanus ferrireducens TaxID=2831190 RepID=UPI00207BC828|nr:hypothetical protein [Desulfovulcanus ferrireducens]MBT8763443.1 hypothetical protein [Desulfovulcanus ferrireducens]
MDVQTSFSMEMFTQSLKQNQFGAQLIQKTLDRMDSNQYQNSLVNQDQEFQTSILRAAYEGRGTMINKLV